MEGVLPRLLWTAGLVLIVNAQMRLVRVQKTEDSLKYCSTWGMYHFQTFDDRTFNFEGKCTYDFCMDCHFEFPLFHITIHRPTAGDENRIYFTANIQNVYMVVSPEGVFIDGEDYMEYETKNGVQLKDDCNTLELKGNGISVIWNWGDNLKVELDEQYKKRVCGMCGNYDNDGTNDIQWKGLNVSYVLFGNLHKTSDPSGDCPDVVDNTPEQDSLQTENKCKNERDQCETIMSQMGDCKYKMNSYKVYLDTCMEDLCKCATKNQTTCLCSNLNQFSKACVDAKGHPGMWRRPDFCYINCPKTMEFFECSSPCLDTCSNPTASILCIEKCKEGCSCPPGTVLDDVNNNKTCVKRNHCPCAHNGKIYKPGGSYSAACQNCTCIFGQWTCNQVACSGNCTVKGGSHIQTYDGKEFNFHGDCQYLMSKDTDKKFVITAKIQQCGMTGTVTCLKAVYIYLNKMTIKICSCGNVLINNFLATLPKINDKVAVFKRSAFYLYVVTSFGLSVKVQAKPVFQVLISVNDTFQNKTAGLCGNFNGFEGDDLMTVSGVIEEAASAFSNSYKVQAECDDVPDYYDNPCSKSIIKEEYAHHWCSRLVKADDVFAPCHEELDPKPYQKNCIYDVCSSENSEEAMCAWLGEYVNECRSRNVFLEAWRNNICDPGCPETMVFTPNPRQCNFTCNSLAESDMLCYFRADPREGCNCPEGTYLAQNDKCVPPEDCPCNYKGVTVPARETFKIEEILCKCIRGILECPKTKGNACKPPMYHYDCSSPDPDIVGTQCQKSCTTQDMECYSHECVPGCVCPKGLVSNDNGGCILPSECPCVYGGKFHDTGTNINISCNTCTCENRTWTCTQKHCPKTCTVYGNGHVITFDQSWNNLMGGCDYILVQDFCPNNKKEGTFQIIIQNIVCGETSTVCSLKIRIILPNATIDLYESHIEERNMQKEKSYSVGPLLQQIVFMTADLTLLYDQKMTITVQLSNSTEGTVCGLCGDNDDRAANDFTSPWSQGCVFNKELRSESPCSNTPEKLAWAQKSCNLIKSDVFASCHLSVDPTPFFDTCVEDTCSCNNDIGDCECLCTSIAAYAAQCRRHDICIKWRTPTICPLFCDYFNKDGHCDWHYNPCGSPCMKTCLNPEGICDSNAEKLEGCFPECSAERPFFDMENQTCIHILNCSVCTDRLCDEKTKECLCCFDGKTYHDGDPLIVQSNGRPCVIGFCFDGYIAMMDTFCEFPTPKVTVTPIPVTRTFPFISEITKTDLSNYTQSILPYTNASTTTRQKYFSTRLVPVSGLSQTSSRSITKRESTFLSKPLLESTSQIPHPYSKASTTFKTKMTTPLLITDIFPTSTQSSTHMALLKTTPQTTKVKYSTLYTIPRTTTTSTTLHTFADFFSTSKITKLPTFTRSTIQTTPPKTTPHITPVKYSTPYPVLISNTTTVSPPYSQTLKTKMTTTSTTPSTIADIFSTSKTTKLRTSSQPIIETAPSKTTPHTTKVKYSTLYTFPRTTTTSTTLHTFADFFSTSKITKLPTFTRSTIQTTPPKTTPHITPVKYSTPYPVLISNTTTVSPPYSQTLKTKMTTTSTTPSTIADFFSTSKTTKLRTSSQPIIETAPSKTTPHTKTSLFVTSKYSTTKPPKTTGKVSPMTTETTGRKSTLQKTGRTSAETFNDIVTNTADCVLIPKLTNITKDECSTLQPVYVNYCSGLCATSSWYSHDAGKMTRDCSCCMDTQISTRTVQLTCLDGSTKPYTYDYVESCSCVPITCHQEN